MDLSDDLLEQQFGQQFVRGAIIRFEFDAFSNPKRAHAVGAKFAIVLNAPSVSDPAYLALTTSKTGFFDKTHQFDAVILRIPVGEYDCFPLPTIIPFRDTPSAVTRAQLFEQFRRKRMTFVGTLSGQHIAEMDRVIHHTPYIRPNLKQFILPDPPES
jgi:hypothetical protein